MADNQNRVQMNQGDPGPDRDRRQRQQQPAPKKSTRRKGKERMTPDQAKEIADRYKKQHSGQPGRRPWTGSPFDPWRHEIVALVKQDLRNDEILRHLKTQDRRLATTSTKLKGWLKREGIRIPKERKQSDGVTDAEDNGAEAG